MLLSMTREELKIVCPEEGGRVFYQLQAVKSELAVSDGVVSLVSNGDLFIYYHTDECWCKHRHLSDCFVFHHCRLPVK